MLPRALLIGDSITRAYNPSVLRELKDHSGGGECCTSKSSGDPGFLRELDTFLAGCNMDAQNRADRIVLRVAPADQAPIKTIVKLTLRGAAMAPAPIGPLVSVTVPASTVYEKSPRYATECAFDDNAGTRWATNVETTQAWEQVDYAKPRRVDSARIEEEIAPRVKQFVLECNEDGKRKPILTEESLGGTISAFERFFPAVSAHNFRLKIPEATDGPSIAEIHFKEPSL